MRIVTGSLIVAALTAGAAGAQVAGQRLGACPERLYIGDDGIAVAAAYSMASDGARRAIAGWRGDPNVQAGVATCAQSLGYAYCTDGLLFGLLDPTAAAITGTVAVIGAAKSENSLIGGLLGAGGAGAVGMVVGAAKAGQCRKQQDQMQPSVDRILAGLQFDLRGNGAGGPNGPYGTIRDRAAELARTGQISAQEAEHFVTVMQQVAARLAE